MRNVGLGLLFFSHKSNNQFNYGQILRNSFLIWWHTWNSIKVKHTLIFVLSGNKIICLNRQNVLEIYLIFAFICIKIMTSTYHFLDPIKRSLPNFVLIDYNHLISRVFWEFRWLPSSAYVYFWYKTSLRQEFSCVVSSVLSLFTCMVMRFYGPFLLYWNQITTKSVRAQWLGQIIFEF